MFTLGLVFSNLCTDYASQIAFCIFYGGTSGGYIGLISVVLIDIIGMEKFIQGRDSQEKKLVEKFVETFVEKFVEI